LKRIVFSEQAKADIRAIPRTIAMNIRTAIHRLAETGAGRVKTLQGEDGEKRLRVGDYRIRFTEASTEKEKRTTKGRSGFTPSVIAGKLTAEQRELRGERPSAEARTRRSKRALCS
jgi:mRNA-degrading endonuclease RelE of RelBE toxin-antitoxin system